MKKPTKYSPIKGKLLRYAGQSIDEQLLKNSDKFNDTAFIFSYLVGINVLGWMVYFTSQPLAFITLKFISIATIFYLCYVIYKLLKLKKHNKNLKLGRDGEKEVAQHLDTLRKEGVHIFHDVINDNKTFNIDHIVISTKGVFTIETKTRMKTSKSTVKCVGNNLIIDNYNDKGKTVSQSKTQIDWLQKKINNNDNKISVNGIITFPGWWIEGKLQSKTVNIINPKNLKKFIESGQDKLTIEEANLISTILYNHVRASAY